MERYYKVDINKAIIIEINEENGEMRVYRKDGNIEAVKADREALLYVVEVDAYKKLEI